MQVALNELYNLSSYWWNEDQHQNDCCADEEAKAEHCDVHINQFSESVCRYDKNAGHYASDINSCYNVHCIV